MLALLPAAVAAAAGATTADTAASPPWEYHGVVFGAGEWSSTDAPLGSARADSSLHAAIASGAGTIRLIPTWYTDGPNSTSVYRAKNGTAEGPFATETDADVGHTIALARTLGAKVILGPLLDPNYALPWVTRAGYPGAECLLWRSGQGPKTAKPANCSTASKQTVNTGEGRGNIGEYFSEPEWDRWFESYSAMMLSYARLADRHGAGVLIVAAEIWAAMIHKPNEARWRQLTIQIRQVFKGKLAVAANAKVVIGWADAIDILGFDMYNGVRDFAGDATPIASVEPPTVEALTAAWGGYIHWLQNVSATHRKPIMATELGYQSRPRSFVSPTGSARFNPGDCSVSMKCVNTEDQRLAYAAFYAAFTAATTTTTGGAAASSPWFVGVVWWLWRSDPSAGGWNDPTFTPKDKPAAAEMHAFAQRQGTLLTPPLLPLPDAPPLPQQGGGGTLIATADTEAAAAGPDAGPWPHKENGIVVGSGEWTSWEDTLRNSSHLDSAAAAESLASAREHGVNSAEFIPTWFFPADFANSTTMYRGQATALPHALATDTDDELRAGITAARKLGMKTSLSPMFDPDYSQLPWWNASSGGPTEGKSLAGGGVGRGKWGQDWSAQQVGDWFAEYGPIIVSYAKLAQETSCESFHVGHELHTLLTNPSNEQHWRGLITQVRAVYKGNVSVAFNGNPFFNDIARGGVPWLDELDFIGLDCYWPIYTNLSRKYNHAHSILLPAQPVVPVFVWN
jgi:hypothetical protein